MEDETFFLRLNNSGFYLEDKDDKLKTIFSLFSDIDYVDVDFYKNYPTIFHLRKALIEGKKLDLRHYYLAIHHIIKYRGHFLFEGENMNNIRDIKKLFADFNMAVGELFLEEDISLPEDKAQQFRDLALMRKGLNDKKKEANAIFNATQPAKKEWLSLLLGGTVSPKKLFGQEFEEKYVNEKSFSFKGLVDENFDALSEVFDSEHFAVLKQARAIFNYIVFEKVLEGKSSISEAMVSLYEKHGRDLALLKKFVKDNYPQEIYYLIFRSTKEKANYANYIGYSKSRGIKKQVDKKCKVEEFYKFLKKTLTVKEIKDVDTLSYILSEIENSTFLPKILNADNGLFPHQINGMELDAILSNLCKNYPDFDIKDQDGYSLAEKIKSIFLFKIPYYIGPLNTAHENGGKGNAWMVRKEGKTDKITPWTFNDIVDKSASNEKFIRRMTNKCTYLHNQDVLPKGSMYYQAFNTLSQINKLTINEISISVELKQELFKNVFLKNKKVSLKHIKEYLYLSGKCSQVELKELTIGGFDVQEALKANMNSYVLFKEKFGELVDEQPQIFEDIILWHTLNTDKSLVVDMILNKYSDVAIIKQNIKWIKGLTQFKEFGRLSKRLLCDLGGGVDHTTGELFTILNRLYHTNYNFNQLIFAEEYSFKQAIDDENSGKREEITYEDITELYVSPMVRRGIWQALTMTEEYVAAVGKVPDKIFIEVTRKDEEKKRTISRKNKLLELYKGLGADCKDIDKLLAELNREDMTDSRLRQERLYLYFLQLGRCAYTGQPIDLDQLSTELYDVDHIIPQALTKDDSLDNKVLVLREKNFAKQDDYPLKPGFTNQQGFWKILKTKGLMSDIKYGRLTRVKPLTDDDFRNFINRQLVITNQTVKAVAELLKHKYEHQGTKIVYSKAVNVDDFKQKFDIIKCRETNDLHHARDAYLNIVVGNVYDTKFTSAYEYFYRKNDYALRQYKLDRIYEKPIDNAWKGKEDIARIKKITSKTSMRITRYSYCNHGEFYDQTIYKKGDSGISAPRKNCAPYNQTDKYGGYKSLNTAYFTIVLSKDKKGNLIKTIEAIPVLVEYQAKGEQKAILEYLVKKGLVEPKILIPKVKLKSLISVNGYKAWIAGMTGQHILLHNAQQWFTDSDIDLYVKQLAKLVEKDRLGRLSENEKLSENIPLISNRKNTTLYATKEKNLELYNSIIATLNKNAYQGLSGVKSFAAKIKDKKNKFIEITTFEQAKVILQIVRFMKCNAENADLALLDDGASCGKLLINKNITNINFALIHQSPCGLTERIQKV